MTAHVLNLTYIYFAYPEPEWQTCLGQLQQAVQLLAKVPHLVVRGLENELHPFSRAFHATCPLAEEEDENLELDESDEEWVVPCIESLAPLAGSLPSLYITCPWVPGVVAALGRALGSHLQELVCDASFHLVSDWRGLLTALPKASVLSLPLSSSLPELHSLAAACLASTRRIEVYVYECRELGRSGFWECERAAACNEFLHVVSMPWG